MVGGLGSCGGRGEGSDLDRSPLLCGRPTYQPHSSGSKIHLTTCRFCFVWHRPSAGRSTCRQCRSLTCWSYVGNVWAVVSTMLKQPGLVDCLLFQPEWLFQPKTTTKMVDFGLFNQLVKMQLFQLPFNQLFGSASSSPRKAVLMNSNGMWFILIASALGCMKDTGFKPPCCYWQQAQLAVAWH